MNDAIISVVSEDHVRNKNFTIDWHFFCKVGKKFTIEIKFDSPNIKPVTYVQDCQVLLQMGAGNVMMLDMIGTKELTDVKMTYDAKASKSIGQYNFLLEFS